jgi:aldose 1-epimerase
MERSSEVRFRGEPALEPAVGELTATFLPATYRGHVHLALPGGLDALRKGSTLGLPLLAPWANRLAASRYEAAGVDVDAPAFPFAHRIEVTVIAREDELTMDTRLFATGSRQVPIAFGWHPYLQLPGSSRSDWQLRLSSAPTWIRARAVPGER